MAGTRLGCPFFFFFFFFVFDILYPTRVTRLHCTPMHHLHETLTRGFYYLKNISKTIWILVMSKLRVPAPFQMRERNATDPFHVTRHKCLAHTCTATVRPLLLAHMRAVLSFCQVEQRCGAHGG